jgi:GxxExxY protein
MHEEDAEIHKEEFDSLSYEVIGLAIEVHKQLGPGLLESAYKECLFYEITKAGLYVEREKTLPIKYKDLTLEYGYRIDLLVENRLVLELKTVENLTPVHFAQVLTYLKLGNYQTGLLFNFNSKILRNSIKRFINTTS